MTFRKLTINPWVADDHCSLWELKLRNLSLYSLVLQGNLLNGDDLISVCVAVDTWSETNIAFNFAQA
jgi:hypothetical protein